MDFACTASGRRYAYDRLEFVLHMAQESSGLAAVQLLQAHARHTPPSAEELAAAPDAQSRAWAATRLPYAELRESRGALGEFDANNCRHAFSTLPTCSKYRMCIGFFSRCGIRVPRYAAASVFK